MFYDTVKQVLGHHENVKSKWLRSYYHAQMYIYGGISLLCLIAMMGNA